MTYRNGLHKILNLFFPTFLTLVIFLISKDNFFYWDNISQISIPANWFYDNSLRVSFVPDNFTTGHLPIIPYYIAIWWKLLGKTLFVSHLALLPFIFGIIVQLKNLASKFFPDNIWHQYIAICFILLDATLLSQLTLITPDIVQTFLYIWAINSLLSDKRTEFTLAISLLGLVSMRGIIALAGLFLFYFWLEFIHRKKRINLSAIYHILPAIIIIATTYGFHLLEKGWVFHNSQVGKWDNSLSFANPYQLAKNILAFGFQQLDYGRVVLWVVLIVFIVKTLKNREKFNNPIKILLVLFITQFLIWFPVTIAFQNFFGHRYFIPIFIILEITAVYIIVHFFRHRKTILISCFVILISGYFWVYPRKFAQGWDATPAHWPYYKARKSMIEYIDSKNYDKNAIASFFPNLANSRYIDLDNNPSFKFKTFNPDLDSLCFYSNTYNIDDDPIDLLFDSGYWFPELTIKKGQVEVILFRRKFD